MCQNLASRCNFPSSKPLEGMRWGSLSEARASQLPGWVFVPPGVQQPPKFRLCRENRHRLTGMGAILLLREIFCLWCLKHLPIYSSCQSHFANLHYIAIFSLLFLILAPTHGAKRCQEAMAELPLAPFPSHLSPPHCPFLPFALFFSSLLFPFARTLCTLHATRSAQVYIDTGGVNL